MDEVLPGVFRVQVPLPRSPLQEINCYVVKDHGRNLIIDTGQDREECIGVLGPALRQLDIDLARTDFFVTHLHADHIGLVSRLAAPTSTIYFSRVDAAVHGAEKFGQQLEFAQRHGFPGDEVQKAIDNHPGKRYGGKRGLQFKIVEEGDVVGAGDYSFECVATPGHTGGHMCLYERAKKVFLSGDHILSDITPNISLWSDTENPLQEYLESLDKVFRMDVDLVLPGHRRTFHTFRERINELRVHHEARANEVMDILEKGSRSVYQVASGMTWDVDFKSWDLFPPQQKWFAFGEALAHLKYLEDQGRVRRGGPGDHVVFQLP